MTKWKCARLKFQNLELMIATDGDLLRVRNTEMIPVEIKLTDCQGDKKKIKTASMEIDVYLKTPAQIMSLFQVSEDDNKC